MFSALPQLPSLTASPEGFARRLSMEQSQARFQQLSAEGFCAQGPSLTLGPVETGLLGSWGVTVAALMFECHGTSGT